MEDPWLVLHGGALGDLVLTIQLALRLPGTRQCGRVELVSRTDPGDLRQCNPRILRRSSEGLGLHWLFGEGVAHPAHVSDPAPPTLQALAAGRRILNCLAGPESSVHERVASLGPGRLVSLDPRAADGVSRHIVDQWLTGLERQGLLIPKCISLQRIPHLGVPDDVRRRGELLLRRAGCGAGPVVIHPGSGGIRKCWPLRGFVELGGRLQADDNTARGGLPGVCFLLGPVEAETWTGENFATLRASFPLLEGLSADELVGVLAAARALVGNDAGPAHLAALLGTPTVVLFGPTSPVVWRPLGASVVALAGDCAADREWWGIAPADVAAAVCNVARRRR